jgi:hypothetical protein
MFKGGNKKSWNLPILWENCLHEFKDRMECQSHATSLINERHKLQVHLREVCTNDMENTVLYIEGFSLRKQLPSHSEALLMKCQLILITHSITPLMI